MDAPGCQGSLMTTEAELTAMIRSLTFIGELEYDIKDREAAKRYHIECARAQGASWRLIGAALGVSTQAAWDRYSGHQRDSEVPAQALLPLTTDGT